MFSLAVKIWFKGVVAFSILCALLAIPSMGIALVALVFGLFISLPAIPFYAFTIYVLKKSEASESYAVFFIFLFTIPAIVLSLYLTSFFDDGFIGFKLNEFYTNLAFWIPWFCAAISIPFTEKHIRAFFEDVN